MASLVAKRPRMAIQNSQRKALRAWYCDPTTTLGAKKTLADASTWWNSQYGYCVTSRTEHISGMSWSCLRCRTSVTELPQMLELLMWHETSW